MGLLDLLKGDRIYLDTNIWVYAIEGYAEFEEPMEELIQAVDRGFLKIVTSELSLAELLIKPIRDGNTELQQIYQKAINPSKMLDVIAVDRDILLRAAEVRAQTGLKLPDAIHAATALSNQCTTFLTNDKQLRAVPELTVVLPSQLNAEST